MENHTMSMLDLSAFAKETLDEENENERGRASSASLPPAPSSPEGADNDIGLPLNSPDHSSIPFPDRRTFAPPAAQRLRAKLNPRVRALSKTNKLNRRGSVNDVGEIEFDSGYWASVKLQSHWKRRQAQAQVKEILEWKLWNDLEGRDEAEMVQLSSFLRKLVQLIPDDEGVEPPLPPELRIGSPHATYALNVNLLHSTQLPTDSLGLPRPLNEEALSTLLTICRTRAHMPLSYVLRIIEDAKATMESLPNIVQVEIAPADRITVVGDLHGQIADLLYILEANGMPSDMNPYIFNGDFVDRGEHGVEVMVLLLALRAVYPEAVFLNRGNHEEREITHTYGFENEVRTKYVQPEVYEVFCDCFNSMPLACLVNDSILVLHGGLFHRDDVTLDDIQALDRTTYHPEPDDDPNTLTNEEDTARAANRLIGDLLWSDPMSRNGRDISYRGMGCKFGPDVAQAFLQRNDLSLLVRSHECVRKGAEFPFGEDGGVLTVFSCSNYCGAFNKGAYVVFDAETLTPEIHEYTARQARRAGSSIGNAAVGSAAAARAAVSPATPVRRVSQTNLQHSNRNNLSTLISRYRPALEVAFRQKDEGSTGTVSRLDWAAVMMAVLQLKLPWLSLQPLLTPATSDGLIDYRAFLDSHESYYTGNQGSASVDALYSNRRHLEKIFRFFDVDNDGQITFQEFSDGCSRLNQLSSDNVLLADPQQLMDMLDLQNDSTITINEFMECFRLMQI